MPPLLQFGSLLFMALTLMEPMLFGALVTHRGHVASVTREAAMVRLESGEFETFYLSPGCRITRNGRPVPLTSLQLGDTLAITAVRRDGIWRASVIEAHAPL